MDTFMTVFAAIWLALGLINFANYRETMRSSKPTISALFWSGLATVVSLSLAGYFISQAVNG